MRIDEAAPRRALEVFTANAQTTPRNWAPDPAVELLRERELSALGLSTLVRAILVGVMAPMALLLGTSFFDRFATSCLLAVYAAALGVSGYLVRRGAYPRAVGLTGVALDAVLIAAMPLVWYASLGGSELPAGIALKTSVTLLAILFVALNTLAMRPLYPLLVTAGALLVHLVILAAAVADERTVFTSSYLAAYTTPDVAVGRVATRIVILAFVGVVLTLLTARARSMIIEAAELQKSNVQLGRYFSPNLVRRLADSPELLGIGGERRELSFVFTDLEGFTALVESDDPAVVVPVLNGYLDELVQVAFSHAGTVDKIVGDAVHVIFGAPFPQPDHAARAVACAMEMDAAAERYRARLAPATVLGVTRIGVNTGTAIVGNFGGSGLFDYTAHGDAINVAARLEGANKYLGTRVCVSAETASRVPDFHGRPIGTLVLAGKRRGIEALEPLDPAGAARMDYAEAYELLHGGQPQALARFEALCARDPDDRLARFHLERLRSGHAGTEIVLGGK